MSATRRAPPLKIYQDPPGTSYDHHEVAQAEAALLEALGPVTDVSSQHHTLLNPPVSGPNGSSPLKTAHGSSSPPAHVFTETNINTISIPPPHQKPFVTDSPKKRSASAHAGLGARTKSQPPLFTTFPSSQAVDKENIFAGSYPQPSAKFRQNAFPQAKPTLKRALTDSGPLRDRTNKKQKVDSDATKPVPAPERMPLIEDNGLKPNYSYAQLIGMAILRAPQRRLTLAQIYAWISTTFAYYQKDTAGGWQNSIRHNLSLNKAFIKQDRPKDDPGKGHYWAIVAGMEHQFLKEKPAVRRNATPAESTPAPAPKPPQLLPPPRLPSFHDPLPTKPAVLKSIDSAKFPDEAELSSDATIPASDPAIHDGQEPDGQPPAHIRSSPPPAEIRSSPPAPVTRQIQREATPPRLHHVFPSSRSGGRAKRRFDSGYYSSIESSAIKGRALGPNLTSEADFERPARMRGRAEEEIVRIRASSYDSPTKNRSLKSASNPGSSSPSRGYDHANAPLTPAVIFKKPARPPASVSPNTGLRNHRNRIRELIGSPNKGAFSPGGELFGYHSVFEDGLEHMFPDVFGPPLDSPDKGAPKRRGLQRASSTANMLADITGLSNPLSGPSTPLKTSYLKSPARIGGSLTPIPRSHVEAGADALKDVSNLLLAPPEELFGVDLPSDGSEEAGFDILQGFQKIGAAAAAAAAAPGPAKHGSPTKKSSRAGLARSATSNF